MPGILRAGTGVLAMVLMAACGPLDDGPADEPSAWGEGSDAASGCPDPGPTPPSDGIVSVDATHGTTDVVVEVGLNEVDPDVEQGVSVTFATPEGAWTYDVDRWVRRDGTARIHTFFTPEKDVAPPDTAGGCGSYMTMNEGSPCRGATGEVDVAAAVVTATVPRPCLENPEWVRVGVRAHFVQGDELVMSDVWDEPERDPDSILPPLGDPLAAAPGAPVGCQQRVPRQSRNPNGPGDLVVVGKRWCIR